MRSNGCCPAAKTGELAWVEALAGGSAAGSWAGAAVGACVGGPVGAVVGGVVGGAIGSGAGKAFADLANKGIHKLFH
ncbi:hypothetical protein E4J66_03875 [Actinomyces viscosus]|nr:hypothetical protein E4J66_03875 [Actinomyces viscosus]